MRTGRSVAFRMLVAALMCVCVAACSHRQSSEGVGGLLGIASPQPFATGGAVGYVDMDAVIASHPLHVQLQALQDQIAVLRQEAVAVPSGMNAEQSAAYNGMQRELASAQAKFEADLAQRRSYYERREADAISQIQAAALGATPSAGGVLSGLQQRYGEQAKQLQKRAFDTLTGYRNELVRQDGEHLKAVQQRLAADMQAKLRQRESELSAAETKYQIDLAKHDQERRLNLQAKLQNLALSDKERAEDTAELQDIDSREQSLIKQLKTRDNAELSKLAKQLQAQAAAKYDAERKAAQEATQAKLVARQREVQTAMAPQMQALGGQFQQQLSEVNQRLASNAKYQTQAKSIHGQMQSSYLAEAERASASYREIRRGLIAKYSAIAHMQFQDNEAVAAQVDKLAADRRDLYQKIADQVRVQVEQIARVDGIAVVFDSVRGAGDAVNLTDEVTKAVAATPRAAAAPTSTSSGGS